MELEEESFFRPWIKVKLKANSNANASVRKYMARNCVENDMNILPSFYDK